MKKINYCEDYFITTCGKVLSFKNKRFKILKNTIGKDGYSYVSLSFNGKIKKFKVHRLVAEAFIPKKKQKEIVNHINEIKTDNFLKNLEWCNKKENLFHGTSFKRMVANQNCKSVKCIKEGKVFKIYRSLREVETDGFCRRHVKKCCEKIKNYNSHKGYRWEYV